VGRTGTYECYQFDRPGRLFIADGHKISKIHRRRGKVKNIDQEFINGVIPRVKGFESGTYARILDDWLTAIKTGEKPLIHARVAANFCMSGIQASRSARDGGKPKKIKNYLN
jgi:hypothetical protein